MAEIFNFPNGESQENTMTNEITRQNKMYLDGMRDRMNAEFAALERVDAESATYIGSIIRSIVLNVIDEVELAMQKSMSTIQAPYFTSQIMRSVNAIMAGGIISPLTGDEEEWHDVTVPEDIGQKFKCEYRGITYEIDIESVQVNIRYPKIYRLNGDNRFAHRIDFIQFHDVAHPGKINLTEDSIRFIQFPYAMNSIRSQCIVNEANQITDYLDFEFDEITNGLVYIDQTTDDADAYIIAPKIPFHMLEGAGINVDVEVAEFIQEMHAEYGNDTEDNDDDDDFYDSHSQPDEDF